MSKQLKEETQPPATSLPDQGTAHKAAGLPDLSARLQSRQHQTYNALAPAPPQGNSVNLMLTVKEVLVSKEIIRCIRQSMGKSLLL